MRTSRCQLANLCGALLLARTLAVPAAQAEVSPVAEPPAEPSAVEVLPDAYARAVNLGFEEYELQHYEEARARFREAHAIYPNARSLRALGAVEYDLQNYVASARYLEDALSSSVRPLGAALRADTEALLERARGYVGVYPVVLVPVDAELEVDGQQAARDGRGTITLPIGEHSLSAKAPGYAELRRRLAVEAGAHDALRLELAPLPEQESSAPASTRRKRWWIWTLAAAVAGGAAAGIAIGARQDGGGSEPSASNLPGVRSVSAGTSAP